MKESKQRKESFYAACARRFEAAAKMYGVDSVVHVEAWDDIRFWKPVLMRYRPGRYKFLPATANEHGNLTTGCTQCLKYRRHLSQRFFICIDSDLRFLLDERISANRGILQTYTYSWENHYAYADKLQTAYEKRVNNTQFDFRRFLKDYSELVYRPMLLMLECERNGDHYFSRENFKRCITVQFQRGEEANNGLALLTRIRRALNRATAPYSDIPLNEERYRQKGITPSNAYLYVRGHSLYNLILSIGTRLCRNSRYDFERDILRESLAFEQYNAIRRIGSDIAILSSELRASSSPEQ